MTQEKEMKHFRQGDVYFIEVSEPQNIQFKEAKGEDLVLAYGEVTGHKHLMVADKPDTQILFGELNGKKYMKIVGGTATVTHEEHGVLTFTPEIVREVRIQREYDPIQYQRQVRD